MTLLIITMLITFNTGDILIITLLVTFINAIFISNKL
jgi:hypothetical protein